MQKYAEIFKNCSSVKIICKFHKLSYNQAQQIELKESYF